LALEQSFGGWVNLERKPVGFGKEGGEQRDRGKGFGKEVRGKVVERQRRDFIPAWGKRSVAPGNEAKKRKG
jgi:hypothetical protein